MRRHPKNPRMPDPAIGIAIVAVILVGIFCIAVAVVAYWTFK
jgi:hypothetical protein